MSTQDGEGTSGAPAARPRFRVTEKKQTGTCERAQADGVPCPDPRCTCDSCSQSLLDREADAPDPPTR